MDSLTHIAIGACIGDLFLGRKIGKRAMIYGAVAASIPDIDFLASFWMSDSGDLLSHRGFTHSLFFATFVVWIMSRFLVRRHRDVSVPTKTWLLFLGTEILLHLFLDAFNAYGIGWFEPFSKARISFNVIFVADPFFSFGPGIATCILLILNRHHMSRRTWAKFGIVCSFLYLSYCLFNKYRINEAALYSLHSLHIGDKKYFTTPTPFNNWLWYVVAETDSGYATGYRSVFDTGRIIRFTYFNRRLDLLEPFYEREDFQQLARFSRGYYVGTRSNHGITFNDLRFGQMMGWQNPDAPFVLHYFLQEPDSNKFLVQRGRFARWNKQTIRGFVNRMKGD